MKTIAEIFAADSAGTFEPRAALQPVCVLRAAGYGKRTVRDAFMYPLVSADNVEQHNFFLMDVPTICTTMLNKLQSLATGSNEWLRSIDVGQQGKERV